jgi:glucose/arabinose dehydrogenase
MKTDCDPTQNRLRPSQPPPPPRPAGRRAALGLLAAVLSAAQADTLNLGSVADTFISDGAPNNNAGATPWFDAGTDGTGAIRRSLIRFDLTAIPAGATITSVALDLKMTKIPGFGAANSIMALHRLNASWTEGRKTGNNGDIAAPGESTWTARASGSANWTTPGAFADVVASPSASTMIGAAAGSVPSWSGPGLVADLQFWLDNPASNHGWLLVSEDEETQKTVRGFGSRESGTSAPRLRVDYQVPPPANLPPTITFDAPTNGATFTAGFPLTLTASATDPDGTVTGVQFFDGATLLGAVTTPPYTLATTLYTGTHTLTAIATDNKGAQATTPGVTNTGVTVPIPNPIADRIAKGDLTIELTTIADGMASPVALDAPDDGSGRLFIADQDGRAWVVTATGRLPTPLLDIRNRLVLLGGYDERGLLGLALHPNFAQNPLLYTYSSEPNTGTPDFPSGLGTTNNHQSVLAEWRIDTTDSNRVDLASRREILRVDKPQSNHNGGALHFGPDGYLYFTIGDGGGANDVAAGHVPGGNAQDLNRALGKLHRIDVDTRNSINGQYGIPTDNPFVATEGLDEIFAYGFRNPFAFSFDRLTGQLYLADVGQNKLEEIDIVIKGGNYGWNIREGNAWFDAAGNIVTAPVRPPPANLLDPIAIYDHDDGSAIIGGHVYRGTAIPALAGRYVFGDWGSFNAPSGRLFYLDATNGVKELRIGTEDRPLRQWLKAIGEGPDGELYVLTTRWLGPSGNTGRLLKIVATPDPITVNSLNVAASTVTPAWTGGTGPFTVQRKNAPADLTWVDAAVTDQRNATLNLDSPSALLRVKDSAHEPTTVLSAYLTGAAEHPANASTASGFALFVLDGNSLTFNLAYQGLSAVATASHIHGPTNTTGNAPVRVDLGSFNGGVWGTNGTLSGVILLSPSQKSTILAGRSYVNIHNSLFPGGEIRGQIAPVNFQVALGGSSQRPTPNDSPAIGLGNLALVGNQLTLDLTYRNLENPAFAAHIHGPADPQATAGVLVDLSPLNGGAWGTSGALSGSVTLSPTQLAALIDGQTYINIHTTGEYAAGEIRGQILPHPTGTPLTALLSGLAERPTPLTNGAAGSGSFSLEGNTLTFNISYAGLSGTATAAHIHGPTDSTTTAGVLVNFAPFNGGSWDTSGTLAGTVALTPAQRDAILAGRTYVNFHTAANPAGELRGQIVPVALTATLSGNNERPTPIATAATGSATAALVRDRLSLVAVYRDLSGPATASHIHGPAGLTATAGVLVGLDSLNGGAYGSSGALSGSVTLPYPALLNINDGQTYINFHTTANGGGEIRGHLLH